MPPLIYAGALPVGAMVRPDPAAAVPPPLHFAAQSRFLDIGPLGGAVGWQSQTDPEAQARHVFYNLEGTDFDPARQALVFSEDRHAGLVIDGVLPQGPPLSIALLFRSTGPEARTLATLQTTGDSDYLFLSGEDGAFRLAGKSLGEVVTVADPGGLTLIVVALGRNATHMAVNAEAPVSGRPCTLPGPVRLFLGCRGDARSLRNKTACMALHDLMIWPDADVLDGAAGAPEPSLAAWQERLHLGI